MGGNKHISYICASSWDGTIGPVELSARHGPLKGYRALPQAQRAKAKSSMTILMKLKRDEVAIINIVQAQVENLYFIFNRVYVAALLRGIPYGLLTKSQCST
jgi:hypothetical protein